MSVFILQGDAERRKGIHYEVDTEVEPIGSGGMGKVYEGIQVDEHNGATRPVAIKFMYDDLPENAYERARREAEIQLRNDNLVEMLGFIETKEQSQVGVVAKHYHVVSELLTGVNLSDVLEGNTKDRNGVDVPFAVKMLEDYRKDPEHFAQFIVLSVLSGVMALHDAGYIHRDIDPSNIMLTTDGRVKLIDFGIAKQMNNLTTGDKSLTVAGKFMGKPEYAAPELVLGDIAHQNQTTDIYAIGILLYQLVVGHTPFEGARHEIMEKQLKSKFPLEKVKNKALRHIIATACEKKAALRYQTSAQMRVALETMNGSMPGGLAGKKTTVMALAAVAVLAVIVAIVLVVSSGNSKSEAELAAQTEMKHKAEAHKQEVFSRIDGLVSEGDNLAVEGADIEKDYYEKSLLKACEVYEQALQVAADNADVGYVTDDIVKKRAEVLVLLDAAADRLQGQCQAIMEEATDSTDVVFATEFGDRAQAITNFITDRK